MSLSIVQGDDIYELRRFAYDSTTETDCLKKLVERVFPECTCQETPDSVPSRASQKLSGRSQRSCSGHEVDICIEEMEQVMDIKGESVATLLCYLELDVRLEIKNVMNDTCTLHYHGGQRQLEALKQKYPAVAKAAELREEGKYIYYYKILLINFANNDNIIMAYVLWILEAIYNILNCIHAVVCACMSSRWSLKIIRPRLEMFFYSAYSYSWTLGAHIYSQQWHWLVLQS